MQKVRYAVVGAGWISQIAFMPSVAQTSNSELVAIVTGNPEARAKLAEFYGITETCGYDGYDALLASGKIDAVYIALPNSQHADFAIRALKAGIHAMVEKPLATTVDECRAMIAAGEESGAYLMTAYRLHNEPGTVALLEAIRAGDIGDVRHFASVFSFQSGDENHRLKREHWGGPLQDIGVYCLNAARHVFGAEPVEVTAMESFDTDPRFTEVHEMIAVTLRFPGDRLASFTVSFGSGHNAWYRVTGSTGQLELNPGYEFQGPTRLIRYADDGVTATDMPDCDHFGGQTEYFSDCILNGEPPEADGAEGLADVLIMRAIEAAAQTGQTQKIDLPPRPRHPDAAMVRTVARTDQRLVL